MTGTTIRQLEELVRELIQEREIRRELNVHPVVQALDAIGDAQAAIDAHENLPESVDYGDLYLAHFGLLQALYLQQDATTTLCTALNVTFNVVERLKHVRDRRDDVAHMTNRTRGGQRWIGIVRISMTRTTFELYAFKPDGSLIGPEKVQCTQFAADQREVIAEALTRIIADLEGRIRAWRSQFKERLSGKPFQGISHALDKIRLAFRKSTAPSALDTAAASASLPGVRATLTHVSAGLHARRILEDDLLADDIAKAEECVAKLTAALNTPTQGAVECEGLSEVLVKAMKHIEEYAQDVDRNYAEFQEPAGAPAGPRTG